MLVSKVSLKPKEPADKPIIAELQTLIADAKKCVKCIRYKLCHGTGWLISEFKDDIIDGARILKEANKQLGMAKAHKQAQKQ